MNGADDMDYLDEELLEAKRMLERQKHATLDTGIYAGEELITFKQTELFDNTIHLPLPSIPLKMLLLLLLRALIAQ